VKLTDGKSHVLLATANGYAIRFGEEDVRPMGRTAHGVRGIALRKDDMVVSMDCCNDEAIEVLTASELGMGKRTSLSDYRKQTRGGKGIINLKITSKTGAIIGSKIINNDQEVIFITAAGVINRQEAKKISTYKRNTQGVKLINLDTGDKLTALAVVSPMDEEEIEETEE
jgi:DNA gyrase subunit A